MNIEEFVNYYLQNYRHEILLNPYNGLIEFAKVFKEQMMKKAVEGKVINDGGEYQLIVPALRTILSKMDEGDKVRVIIVKENEK